VLGYGADPTVVLVRKNEAIDPKLVNIPKPVNIDLYEDGQRRRYYSYGSDTMQGIRVVFCSKVYYGVEIARKGALLYFWQADKIRTWAASQKTIEVKVGHHHWSSRKKEYKLETYFEPKEASASLRDFMITNRYAIILEMESGDYRQQRKCWMNPYGLKSIGFQKALDPYTAYQELSMWVGGVLAGESPKTVKITSDKVLLEGHGFDNVFLFRGPRLK